MLLEQSLQPFHFPSVVLGEQRLQAPDLLSGLVDVGKLNKKSLIRTLLDSVLCVKDQAST
jgi:hypothetical protein